MLRGDDFKGMVFAVLGSENTVFCQQFAMVLWCLWKRQNEKVWEDLVKPVNTSLKLAMDMLMDWLAVPGSNTNNHMETAVTTSASEIHAQNSVTNMHIMHSQAAA
jgi:hypothetical protein